MANHCDRPANNVTRHVLEAAESTSNNLEASHVEDVSQGATNPLNSDSHSQSGHMNLEDTKSETCLRLDAVGIRTSYFVLAVCIFLPFGSFLLYNGVVNRAGLGIAIGLGLILSPFSLYRMTLRDRHLFSLVDLEYSNDKCNIGELIDALGWPNERAQHIAISGLTRLLPTLTPEDDYLLTRQQRNELYHWLQPKCAKSHNRLVLALLNAIEVLQDVSAVPMVRALCKSLKLRSPDNSKVRQLTEVRRAAQHCLQFLEQLEEEDETRHSLLRASDGATALSEELLRSMASASQYPSDQLLRVNQQVPTQVEDTPNSPS